MAKDLLAELSRVNPIFGYPGIKSSPTEDHLFFPNGETPELQVYLSSSLINQYLKRENKTVLGCDFDDSRVTWMIFETTVIKIYTDLGGAPLYENPYEDVPMVYRSRMSLGKAPLYVRLLVDYVRGSSKKRSKSVRIMDMLPSAIEVVSYRDSSPRHFLREYLGLLTDGKSSYELLRNKQIRDFLDHGLDKNSFKEDLDTVEEVAQVERVIKFADAGDYSLCICCGEKTIKPDNQFCDSGLDVADKHNCYRTMHGWLTRRMNKTTKAARDKEKDRLQKQLRALMTSHPGPKAFRLLKEKNPQLYARKMWDRDRRERRKADLSAT